LGVIECKNREAPITNTDYKIIIEKAIKLAKIKRIEKFLNNLRPIFETDIIELFEKFIMMVLIPCNMFGNSNKSQVRVRPIRSS
jgi:hypothetical protein